MTVVASVPPLSPGRYAFFFDLDGTLAEIQPHPDSVLIPDTVKETLKKLVDYCDGAVALVSGRSMTELDHLSAPLHLPLAGVHGAERRDAAGISHATQFDADLKRRIASALATELQPLKGAHLEKKSAAFALHYRQAPQYEKAIWQIAESLAAIHEEIDLQPGKCVIEVKLKGSDKGTAIDAFMQEAPFIGRIPVFLGDDLTDELGFDAVNRRQGISIKVGDGETRAQRRLEDVSDVWKWLDNTVRQFKEIDAGNPEENRQ